MLGRPTPLPPPPHTPLPPHDAVFFVRFRKLTLSCNLISQVQHLDGFRKLALTERNKRPEVSFFCEKKAMFAEQVWRVFSDALKILSLGRNSICTFMGLVSSYRCRESLIDKLR